LVDGKSIDFKVLLAGQQAISLVATWSDPLDVVRVAGVRVACLGWNLGTHVSIDRKFVTSVIISECWAKIWMVVDGIQAFVLIEDRKLLRSVTPVDEREGIGSWIVTWTLIGRVPRGSRVAAKDICVRVIQAFQLHDCERLGLAFACSMKCLVGKTFGFGHVASVEDCLISGSHGLIHELEQTTALAAEAKSVLDSWVRYEGQVKIRQQKELSESIIAKIQKELENPKVLQQILQQSVADVEKIVQSKAA